MSGVLLLFVAELGVITYRNTKKGAQQNVGGLPLASTYLAAVVVYGVAGEIAKGGGSRGTAGTLLAGAVTLATVMNLWDPASPTSIGKQAATSGSTTQASTGTGGGPQTSESGRNTKG